MQVGRTFGPTNGDPMQGGGGGQGPSNPIADAIRILSLQVPQTVGANSPTGAGLNTPSMMGGQMGNGLLLQWLRSLLGSGGGQPGGDMPGGGGMPGGGMPGGGGRFQHALPGAMTPAFNFVHGGQGGQPGQPGQQLPQPPAPPVANGPMPQGGGNGVNWAQGFQGANPNPGMDGTMLAGRR